MREGEAKVVGLGVVCGRSGACVWGYMVSFVISDVGGVRCEVR